MTGALARPHLVVLLRRSSISRSPGTPLAPPRCMSSPFALLPFALAGGNGRVDAFETQQLVAAGFTLLRRCAPLVRALDRRRSAILLPTSPRMLVALAASDGRGAVLVNPLAAPLEIAHQLRDAGVGAVFTTAALASRLPREIPCVLLDDAPRSSRFVSAGASRDVDLGSHLGLPLEGEREVRGRDEEAAVVYTSAMAGVPLGAILTHRNLLANARSTVTAALLGADDHTLALLPLAHLFGLTVAFDAPLLAGGHVTTMERFSPVAAVEHLRNDGVTAVVGVPAVFHALVAQIARRGVPREAFAALRVCICGGAELPVALQERWAEATGVELRQGYGLSEAGPVCLYNRGDLPNVRGTLGVPFPGVDVSLRSPLGWTADGMPAPGEAAPGEVAPREVGEICVRGDNVFRGYVSGGEAGLQRRDGWLHTGDLGRRAPGGEIVFAGLVKPMFTRSGFNVYPREVERAVLELDGVDCARVHPIESRTREHDVALEVAGAVEEPRLREWSVRRLAQYKHPSQITVHP